MEGEVLQQKPIQELEIEVGLEYGQCCMQWLQSNGIGTAPVAGRPGFYTVTFPPGTVEEARSGQSGQTTLQTALVLPNGLELTKIVFQPLSSQQRRRVTMSFPNAIFW